MKTLSRSELNKIVGGNQFLGGDSGDLCHDKGGECTYTQCCPGFICNGSSDKGYKCS